MDKQKCKIKLYWTTTIWPKWQLVIPKEIRDLLQISPWDSMTIMLKDNKFIWILKNDDLKDLINYLKNEWIELE